jgi:ribosomal protein S18 acetylase RimI-like enzyme
MIRRARAADAAAIARVHVDSWRAAYRGIVPDSYLDGLSYGERERRWSGQLAAGASSTHVAETEAGIVGFATGGDTASDGLDSDGELYAIYLLPAAWRHGLGRALFAAVVADLDARECVSLGVWVLRDNVACRFYESLGGTPVAEAAHEIGGVLLPKVAYHWPSLPRVTGTSNSPP